MHYRMLYPTSRHALSHALAHIATRTIACSHNYPYIFTRVVSIICVHCHHLYPYISTNPGVNYVFTFLSYLTTIIVTFMQACLPFRFLFTFNVVLTTCFFQSSVQKRSEKSSVLGLLHFPIMFILFVHPLLCDTHVSSFLL